jgi:hypothetical protein
LVGYLENIISDRKLIQHCSLRLDILFFIDYDRDDELPWYSTISRTRQLFPEQIFEEVFTNVLQMCIEKGMVSEDTQTIDSAPVKANASMDTLELKVPEEDLASHLQKTRHICAMDKEAPLPKSKENKASQEQQTISANNQELAVIKVVIRSGKKTKTNVQEPVIKVVNTQAIKHITAPLIQMPV